jgi:hypothetical protein
MAEQTEQEQIETTVGHVVGAIYARSRRASWVSSARSTEKDERRKQ